MEDDTEQAILDQLKINNMLLVALIFVTLAIGMTSDRFLGALIVILLFAGFFLLWKKQGERFVFGDE